MRLRHKSEVAVARLAAKAKSLLPDRVRFKQELRRKDLSPEWKLETPFPYRVSHASKVSIGENIFVIGGQTKSRRSLSVLIFRTSSNRWTKLTEIPKDCPSMGLAVCSDNFRYIYIAGGIHGNKKIANSVFRLDSHSGVVTRLANLPQPSYGGLLYIDNEYLYLLGGAETSSLAASKSKWRLALTETEFGPSEWIKEDEVPFGIFDAASILNSGSLYVFGGKDHPESRCCSNRAYQFVINQNKWIKLAGMPIGVSYHASGVVFRDGEIYISGGLVYGNQAEGNEVLTDRVQRYTISSDGWDIAGFLPYRVLGNIALERSGRLFIAAGQRDFSFDVPGLGQICRASWSTSMPLKGFKNNPNYFHGLEGKKVVCLTPELRRVGATLLLLELISHLNNCGAQVRLFSDDKDIALDSVTRQYGVALLENIYLEEYALSADLIIGNSVVSGPHLANLAEKYPFLQNRIFWWIHDQPDEDSAFSWLWNLSITPGHIAFDSHNIMDKWNLIAVKNCVQSVVHLSNRRPLVDAARMERLPWPLAEKKKMLSRQEARKALRIEQNTFLVCCLGVYYPKKGQDLLIKAVGQILDEHPDLPLQLLIVGVRCKAEKKRLIKSLTLSEKKALKNGILLLPHAKDYEIYYRISDAHVSNTQGKGESFGRVTIEAMAFGLPVLGTNCGGSKEIIDHGVNGLLHPSGIEGMDQLKRNILHLLRNPDVASEMGRKGQEKADNYFCEIRQYEQLASILQPLAVEA